MFAREDPHNIHMMLSTVYIGSFAPKWIRAGQTLCGMWTAQVIRYLLFVVIWPLYEVEALLLIQILGKIGK